MGRAAVAAALGVAVGSALLGLVANGGPARSADLPAAVVRLRSERCGATRHGLGVRLADGRTVTAGHVVAAAWQVDVGSQRAATAAVSTSADVAVVGGTAFGSGLEVGRDVRVGADVRVVDRRTGGWRSAVVSVVNDEWIELSLTGEPGDSGGPVVDAGGRLVGVVVALDPSTRRVRAIGASRLSSAIDGPLIVAPSNRC